MIACGSGSGTESAGVTHAQPDACANPSSIDRRVRNALLAAARDAPCSRGLEWRLL